MVERDVSIGYMKSIYSEMLNDTIGSKSAYKYFLLDEQRLIYDKNKVMCESSAVI